MSALTKLAAPVFELIKDGITKALDPLDEATGEIDLTEVSDDLVTILKAVGLPIPEGVTIKALVIDTK